MIYSQESVGNNEVAIWNELAIALQNKDAEIEYHGEIHLGDLTIIIDIQLDYGGGFEGGFENTSIKSTFQQTEDFRFAIHHQGWLDELGRFLAMQDVETGYPEFDDAIMVKSNNEEKVKELFSPIEIRQVFQSLDNFSFGISHPLQILHSDEKPYTLLFSIDNAITDTKDLHVIYIAFRTILLQLVV